MQNILLYIVVSSIYFNAKNINSTVEDQFTLIVDPILKSQKDLAKIIGTTLKEKAEIVKASEIQ